MEEWRRYSRRPTSMKVKGPLHNCDELGTTVAVAGSCVNSEDDHLGGRDCEERGVHEPGVPPEDLAASKPTPIEGDPLVPDAEGPGDCLRCGGFSRSRWLSEVDKQRRCWSIAVNRKRESGRGVNAAA
jgi:hypothetical protein